MSILTKASALIALSVIAGCAVQKPVQAQQAHTHHNSTHNHDTHHHDNAHDHTPHGGIVMPLYAKHAPAGFAELKLHDDKGDLELWLTRDESGKEPLDLPLNSTIRVFFPSLAREVTLQIRNSGNNEGEDGLANIRNNKTNYFIFPGKTGEDASFLMGKDFATKTIAAFKVNNIPYTTGPFRLYPHTH